MLHAWGWAHLDAVKRPKMRGFCGSRVWRRKTSSAERRERESSGCVLGAGCWAAAAPGERHSPSWSKCVCVPWGPGMEHSRRALRKVLQRLMRPRFPPTSFCWALSATKPARPGIHPPSPAPALANGHSPNPCAAWVPRDGDALMALQQSTGRGGAPAPQQGWGLQPGKPNAHLAAH